MQYPVYVISLAKDEERRNSLKKQFNSYNEFQIIDAVEGNKIDIQQYFKYLSGSLSKYNILISPNELGCTLSHIKAYEAFLATDAEYCLILEDDVLGNDEMIEQAFSLTNKVSKNSMIILGGIFNSVWGYKVVNDFYTVSKYALDKIYGAFAYIIDRECAKNLLAIQLDTGTVADAWYVLLPPNHINLYYSHLFQVDFDNIQSNIEIEREHKSLLGLNIKSLPTKGLTYYFSMAFWDKLILKCRGKYIKFRKIYL